MLVRAALWPGVLRWRAVLIVAALLGLAMPMPSVAQYTGAGAAAPAPAAGGPGLVTPSTLTRGLIDSVQVEAGYTYDDNVTLGRSHDEILWDQLLWLDLSASHAFRVDDHVRFVVTGLLHGEKFSNYDGLSNLSGGLEAELQYRQSGAFDAITFAAFARGWLDNYASHLRDGSHYSFGLSAHGALTDRLGLFGEVAWNQRRAQSEVWDLTDWSGRLNLDYSLEERGTLYISGEYRRGDVVSDGHATLENVSLAQVFVLDDAFPGKDLFAYRSDARTWVSTLGYNLPVGHRASIDFSWRRVDSKPTATLPFDVQGSLRYVDNQYTVVFLKAF
jgi:hypothetical protein